MNSLIFSGFGLKLRNIFGNGKIQVRVCSGKPMTIVASREGFYPAGKRALLCRSLVSLLQQISRVFDSVSSNSKLTCRLCVFALFLL
jgi:hypothetical protein